MAAIVVAGIVVRVALARVRVEINPVCSVVVEAGVEDEQLVCLRPDAAVVTVGRLHVRDSVAVATVRHPDVARHVARFRPRARWVAAASDRQISYPAGSDVVKPDTRQCGGVRAAACIGGGPAVAVP